MGEKGGQSYLQKNSSPQMYPVFELAVRYKVRLWDCLGGILCEMYHISKIRLNVKV